MKGILTKTNAAILALAVVISIVGFLITLHNNRSYFPNTFVMDYSAFKPESLSDALLGQRDSRGVIDSNSETEVRVVIYRNIDLSRVKENYPTLNGRYDYRFVQYREAVDFLESHIAELKSAKTAQKPGSQLLISECEQTRAQIIEKLGP